MFSASLPGHKVRLTRSLFAPYRGAERRDCTPSVSGGSTGIFGSMCIGAEVEMPRCVSHAGSS